jgi:hypothetical protein
MPRSTRPLRYIRPKDADPNTFFGSKYYYQNFKSGVQPLTFTTVASGFGVLTVAGAGAIGAAATHKLFIPGCPVNWDIFGHTAQTNTVIGTLGSGLEISGDEVDNEGLELVIGQLTASNPLARTIGTDSDFFFRAKFKVTDASGADEFGIGWRKNEAFSASFAPSAADPIYTDFAMIGFAGTSANPNPVRTSTDLNNSGTGVRTSTGFTWADTLVHKLEIRVKSGAVQYLINDVPLGGTISKDGDGNTITAQNTSSGAAFTFDSTDVLVPFIFLQHDADVCEDLFLQEIEIGSLVDIGLDPGQE